MQDTLRWNIRVITNVTAINSSTVYLQKINNTSIERIIVYLPTVTVNNVRAALNSIQYSKNIISNMA